MNVIMLYIYIYIYQIIPPLHPDQINSLTFIEDDVYYILCQFDPNKATGMDKISPKVLKNCALIVTDSSILPSIQFQSVKRNNT